LLAPEEELQPYTASSLEEEGEQRTSHPHPVQGVTLRRPGAAGRPKGEALLTCCFRSHTLVGSSAEQAGLAGPNSSNLP